MSEPDETMVEAVAVEIAQGRNRFPNYPPIVTPMDVDAARAVLSVPALRDALADAATHEAEILRLIDERDEAQEWADRLAAVAGGPDVIGEHSNANNPWANALELLQGERG